MQAGGLKLKASGVAHIYPRSFCTAAVCNQYRHIEIEFESKLQRGMQSGNAIFQKYAFVLFFTQPVKEDKPPKTKRALSMQKGHGRCHAPLLCVC
jgi:hypothetical protein